jgi:hypothetical protein
MSSLTDILTTQKNGVVALNLIATTLARAEGFVTSQTVTSDTLVVLGKGYLVNFSVVVAGSADGAIYNYNSTTTPPASSQLVTVPSTLGVVQCGQVFTSGLVISPGTGQSINVTYSVG